MKNINELSMLRSEFDQKKEVGLGLSISKQIVNLYGGELVFSSKFKKGSSFSFWFVMETCDNLNELNS